MLVNNFKKCNNGNNILYAWKINDKWRFRVGIKMKKKKNLYSHKDPENLSKNLMQFKVASKINFFLLLSNRESPYESMPLLSLSDKDPKLSRFYTIHKIKTML